MKPLRAPAIVLGHLALRVLNRGVKREPAWREFLNAYFDKILVLTIPRNTSRHRAVARRLEGVNFELYFGLDAKSCSPEELYSHYDAEENRKHWYPLSPGYIACSLNHARIYERIVREGYRRSLVFEDDVDLASVELLPMFFRNLDRFDPNWELARLGYGNQRHEMYVLDFVEKIGRPFNPRLRLGHPGRPRLLRPLVRSHGEWHNSTVAYALSQEGARKLAEFAFPIRTNADHLLDLAVQRGVIRHAYVAAPRLFKEAAVPSSIDPNRRFVHR